MAIDDSVGALESLMGFSDSPLQQEKVGSTYSFFSYLQEKVHTVSCSLFTTIRSFFCESSEKAIQMYTRSDGYWTSRDDEKKDDFFTKLIPVSSQRENWYEVTPYIAEFWCTVSSVAFIAAGILQGSPELVFAGAASALSHAIPRKWLLTVDKIGVLICLSKLITERQCFHENPWLLAPVTLAGAICCADTYLSQRFPQASSHVVWHLSSAAIASGVLSVIKASKQ